MTTYGLFLNMGANLGQTTEDVFALTMEQAQLAESLGYHDLWVTEHHCIPFGINPSAITASAFLLGATQRMRVGTAVTLSPLYHPLEVAERTALLDQFSGGRFDLGLGRGGYLKDYELLDLDPARWEDEPIRTAKAVVDIWRDGNLSEHTQQSGESIFQPKPLTRARPPLFLATRSADAIAYAAEYDIPLQHYFAVPAEVRAKQETLYRELNPADVEHVHTLVVVVGDDEEKLRSALQDALTVSFRGGDWPHIPQVSDHHPDTHGKATDRSDRAAAVAAGALVGPPARVREQLDQFIEITGAKRLVLYMEAIADAALTRTSIQRFMEEVA
ncbi:MAG: LLM class flavin-dependent oxidoreductase [Pseudomonadota bacterium]